MRRENSRLILPLLAVGLLAIGSKVHAQNIPAEQLPAPNAVASTELRLPISLVPREVSSIVKPTTETPIAAAPLVLPPRSGATSQSSAAAPTSGRAITTTITSLGVVLGLFLLLVWFQRKTSGRGSSKLPGDVIETLGRAPLNGRQEMQLVRVGNKLLLLAVTPTSAETLTEITDPREIDRLTGICEHPHAGSISASFREILSHLNSQETTGDFHAHATH